MIIAGLSDFLRHGHHVGRISSIDFSLVSFDTSVNQHGGHVFCYFTLPANDYNLFIHAVVNIFKISKINDPKSGSFIAGFPLVQRKWRIAVRMSGK